MGISELAFENVALGLRAKRRKKHDQEKRSDALDSKFSDM